MINELRQRLDPGLLHKAASTSLLSGVTDHELNSRVGVTMEPGPRRWAHVPFAKVPKFQFQRVRSFQPTGCLGWATAPRQIMAPCSRQGLVPDAASPLAAANKRKLGTTTERSCVPCDPLNACPPPPPPHSSALAAFQRDRK